MNTFLPEANRIVDIASDLADGVALCLLLEGISSKVLPKWNAKPKIKAQKLENASIGLAFIKAEGVRLVA